MTDTIFALSTGSYRSAIAVIRVSGPKAIETFQLLTSRKKFTPRQGMVVTLADPVSRQTLDFRALASVYPGPASFTGEDTVEFNVHGGRAVIEGILRSLSHIPACRAAEPGEFTKRAFQNSKLDLTEAEAIADLIDAETEMQKMQAIGQAHGALFQLYSKWADTLSTVLAHQEADIEFPEDDLPGGLTLTQKPQIEQLRNEIREHLDDNRRGERLRNGIRIAIIGAPNAGKSSLMNALARRNVAIVSAEAGTTRDVIEVHLDLGGYPVILADTAGLRETDNSIEAEGIRRAETAARDADLKIALFDGTLADKDAETMKLVDENTVIVFTKADIAKKQTGDVQVSSSTGEGIDGLLKQITAAVAESFKSKSGPVLTRERYRAALVDTAAALDRCLATAAPELAAEDLRLALRALGSITGRVHVEDLLDKIFRDFCIGK